MGTQSVEGDDMNQPHSKQFAIVRDAIQNNHTEYQIDGLTCHQCHHGTVSTDDKSRRYCLNQYCHALILEEL